MPEGVSIIITAVVAFVLAFVLVKMLDRLRRRDAETEARTIMEKAEREASNLKREAELQMKEAAIQQKATGEHELGQLRQELHERERLLDKRQDVIEQQAEGVRKQERMVESNQRKLADRIEDANRRNEELTKLLDLQRQTLHQLSGLSREDATSRLLEMLDQELQNEQGSLIVKAERTAGRNRRDENPRNPPHFDSSLRRRPHGRNDHQHRRYPKRRDERPDHRPRGPQHPGL